MKSWRSYTSRLRGMLMAVIASSMAIGSIASASAGSTSLTSEVQIDYYGILAKPAVGTSAFIVMATLLALAAVALHRSIANQASQENHA